MAPDKLYSITKNQLGRKSWKVPNGQDDLKTALYAGPNHTNNVIHSDHGYLDTWDEGK